jgi:hypothetical protein
MAFVILYFKKSKIASTAEVFLGPAVEKLPEALDKAVKVVYNDINY